MPAGSRMRRGFHRLGLVVAVPAVVLAVAVGALGAVNLIRAPAAIAYVPYPESCRGPESNPFRKYEKPGLFDDLVDEGAHQRCLVQHQKQSDERRLYDANRRAIDLPYEQFMAAGAAAGLAILWYGFFWALGWVLAGFARDQETA